MATQNSTREDITDSQKNRINRHTRPFSRTEISLLERLTPEQIEDDYRRGYISTRDRNTLMREKAKSVISATIERDGYFRAVFDTYVKELQEGWDDFTLNMGGLEEGSTEAIDKSFLRNAGLSMWGQIRILIAPITAFGEVNNQIAEDFALDAGASPGLAKVIGLAVEVGVGFIPTGLAAKSFAGGVQKIGRAVGKVDKSLKAAKAAKESLVAEAALAEGLAKEGVSSSRIKKTFDVTEDFVTTVEKNIPPTMQEQFAKDIQKFRAEMKDITATKAREITLTQADELRLNVEDVQRIMPGQSANEVEMAAYLLALNEPIERVLKLASNLGADASKVARRTLRSEVSAAKKAGTTAEELRTLRAAKTKALDIQTAALRKEFVIEVSELIHIAPKFRGLEVTAGRSVDILSQTPIKRMTDMIAGWHPEAIAKGDFAVAIDTVVDDMLEIAGSKSGFKRHIVAQQGGLMEEGKKWWDAARGSYLQLLMLRPLTAVKTFAGNMTTSLNFMAERELAGWLSIDALKGAKTGEGVLAFKGWMSAQADGLAAWATAYKGVNPAKLTSRMDEIPIAQMGPRGILQRVLALGADTVAGIDRYTQVTMQKASLYIDANRLGRAKGLTGEALEDFAAKKVAMPSREMRATAEQLGKDTAFMSELGTTGKTIKDLLQKGPLSLYNPFIKTGINMAKYSFDRTPGIQLVSRKLYRDILAGGVQADMAVGRLALSNSLGQFYYGLAKIGMLSGGGPTDRSLRRVWELDNERYSLKTQAGFFPLRNFEPQNTPAAIIADVAQITNQLSDSDTEKILTSVGIAMTRDILDKMWWGVVGETMEAIGRVGEGASPGGELAHLIQKPLVTVATGGPFGQAITRVLDPTRREARGLVDTILSKTLGFSKDQPPARDAAGDPILIPQALGPEWFTVFSPLTVRPRQTDPVKKEMERLQLKIAPFPRSVGGSVRDDFDVRTPLPGDRVPVGLNPAQRDRWAQIYSDIIKHPELGAKKNLLDNPAYKDLTLAAKRQEFKSYLSEARSSAFEDLTLEDPTLAKALISAKGEQVAPFVGPEEQDKLRLQIDDAKGLVDTLDPSEFHQLMRYGDFAEPEPPKAREPR